MNRPFQFNKGSQLLPQFARKTVTAFGRRSGSIRFPPMLPASRNRAFPIAERYMIRLQSRGKAQMKTILMLIVGLILAGCGSMDNHVRNQSVASTSAGPLAGPGDRIAVDTICACP